MQANKYIAYTIKDFLDDDAFAAWVTNPTAESDEFWDSFIQQHPEKENDINQSVKFISNYRNQDTFFNEDNQDKVWQKIESEIQLRGNKKPSVFRLIPLLRIAAVLVLISAAALIFFQHKQKITIQARYGEIKSVLLPDNSVVVLNGNSALTYERGWGATSREVWLKGEAFFNIKHLNKDPLHIKSSERFIVHSDNLNVEVLGTTFDVKNRHSKIDVGLLTGKIRLSAADVSKGSNELILNPGDYVEYAAGLISPKSRLTHPENLVSWSQRRFIFNNARLGDILSELVDTYGYRIKLSDPRLKNTLIEGEINVNGVKQLLELVSTSLNVNIYQNNNNIIIN